MTIFFSLAMTLLVLQGGNDVDSPLEPLQSLDREVAVDAVTEDTTITNRLREILDTTGRYGNVTVDVRHGVVFFEGQVRDESEGAWLGDLAARTEGVVAVSNRVRVPDPPAWSLTPATTELRRIWRDILAAAPRFIIGLFVMFVAGFLLRSILRPLVRRFVARQKSELLKTVTEKLISIAVWIVALYIFLQISGLTQIAVTVVGGTGVLGIVLGFAFRDIAENFLASILISIQKPFRYGDTIAVDDHVGVVQRVTPRGTILMDFNGNHIQIANATVYKSTIKNFTANPNVRQDFTVGIGYDASISRAQEIVMETICGHSAVLEEPKPLVLVEHLASATINLRIYFWVDGNRHSKVKVRSALMRLVLQALNEAGVSMPDDAREIIFPHGVPVRMECQPATGAPSPAGETATVDRPPAKEERSDDSVSGSVPRRGLPRQTLPATESAPEESSDESTEAEGDLASETAELNEQARLSRQPEEGADILAR